MYYVINRNDEIVSRHETKEQAETAKTENQTVLDPGQLKALIYGLSPSQLAHSGGQWEAR